MLYLLADENLNGHIIRGLLRRRPEISLLRVQDVGLLGASDPDILEWAAINNRILVTHDQATVPEYAYERIVAGQLMPGVFVLNDQLSQKQSIEELMILDECSEQKEWSGRVIYLPF